MLRFAYRFIPVEICEALRKLFGLPNVHLNNASLVAQSLQWHEAGLDFADAFHLANSQNHTQFYTNANLQKVLLMRLNEEKCSDISKILCHSIPRLSELYQRSLQKRNIIDYFRKYLQ